MATVRRRAPLALLLLLLVALIGVALFMVLAPDDGAGPGTGGHDAAARDDDAPAPSAPRTPRERVIAPTPPADTRGEPPGGDAPSAARAPRVAPEAPRRTVNVTVQREGGVPVRGAHVAASPVFGGSGVLPGGAETDIEGRATISLAGGGAFVVRAWTDDAAALGDRLTAAPGETLDVTLRLEPGRPAVARVLTEASMPIAGARFTLLVQVDDPFGRSVSGTTDDDGRVDLGLFPARLLDHPRTRAYADARGYVRDPVPVADTTEGGEIVLRLARGQVVRGRCVAAGAAPVSGVRVSVPGVGVTTTDDDGRYEITGVPWEGGVLSIVPPAHAAPAPLTLPAAAGEIDLGDVVLTDGLPISGIVVDDLDRPVAGAKLSAVRRRRPLTVRTALSDALGRFTLPHIGDGPHTIVAEGTGEEGWNTSLSVRARDIGAGTTDLRLTLSEGRTLLVTFKLESDGSAVSVATVEVEYERTDGGEGASMSAWSGPDMTSVRIPFQDAGTYRVTLKVPGYEDATLEGVTISDDGATRLDALFRRAPPR